MPDRAVVDDDEIKAKIRQRVRQLEDENNYDALMSQPRAVVAISEDRQWLVVLDPEPYAWGGDDESVYWSVYRWNHDDMLWEFSGDETPNPTNSGGIKDTGQDAHDVLAAFLEGREG